MPSIDSQAQRTLWQLADELIKALNTPGDSQDQDSKNWGVEGTDGNTWSVSHPELPIVKDSEEPLGGIWGKDSLLQLQIQKLKDGKYAVLAQNLVQGEEDSSVPQAFVVAKEDKPPGKTWNTAQIALAAANWFKDRLRELKAKASQSAPQIPPGTFNSNPPVSGGLGGFTAAKKSSKSFSRRERLATAMLAEVSPELDRWMDDKNWYKKLKYLMPDSYVSEGGENDPAEDVREEAQRSRRFRDISDRP